MKYTLNITCEENSEAPACMHRPVAIETMTNDKQQISDEELEAVGNFFKQQVIDLLLICANRDV